MFKAPFAVVSQNTPPRCIRAIFWRGFQKGPFFGRRFLFCRRFRPVPPASGNAPVLAPPALLSLRGGSRLLVEVPAPSASAAFPCRHGHGVGAGALIGAPSLLFPVGVSVCRSVLAVGFGGRFLFAIRARVVCLFSGRGFPRAVFSRVSRRVGCYAAIAPPASAWSVGRYAAA